MGERRVRRRADAQVGQLAAAGAQAVADLPQAFRLGEVQIQHRHTLMPGSEGLAVPVGFGLPDQAIKGAARHDVQELGKEAGIIGHVTGSLYGGMVAHLPYGEEARHPPPTLNLSVGRKGLLDKSDMKTMPSHKWLLNG